MPILGELLVAKIGLGLSFEMYFWKTVREGIFFWGEDYYGADACVESAKSSGALDFSAIFLMPVELMRSVDNGFFLG